MKLEDGRYVYPQSTSVRISKETRNRLEKYGNNHMTLNDVIAHLLDKNAYQEKPL